MRLRLEYLISFCLLPLLLCDVALSDPGVQGEWVRCERPGAGEFISNFVTAVASDDRGRVWVGTDRGLAWTSDDGRTWNVVNLAYAKPQHGKGGARDLSERELITRNTVTAVVRGRSGLWVGRRQ